MSRVLRLSRQEVQALHEEGRAIRKALEKRIAPMKSRQLHLPFTVDYRKLDPRCDLVIRKFLGITNREHFALVGRYLESAGTWTQC